MAGLSDPSVVWAMDFLELRPGFTSHDLRARFKSLSLVHHPDKGGSHDTMVLVGRACEVLRLVVDGVFHSTLVVTPGPSDSAREVALGYARDFFSVFDEHALERRTSWRRQ